MKARTVEAYLDGLDPPLRKLVEGLRHLVQEAAPQLEETIKWGVPTYRKEGNLLSIMAHAHYVRLQFFDGAELRDRTGLLEGTGKGMRHVKIRSPEDLESEALRELLREAVAVP